MTEAPELLPCPFCGRPAGYQAIKGNNPKPFAWDVIHFCAVGGGTGWIRISPRDANGRGTQKRAADAWNTRANPIPAMLAAERAAVIEAALQELGYAAWRHEGDDSYSIGLEAGARRQSQADFDAIRALSDDAVTAARAAIEAEGYRRGLEAAAKIAEGRAGNNLADAPPVIAFDRGYVDGCTSAAAAIRALIGGRR